MGRPPKEAVEILQEAIEELAANEPELELELETKLIGIARFEPDLYPLAAERLQRLQAALPDVPAGQQRSFSRTSLPRVPAPEQEERPPSRSPSARSGRHVADPPLRSRVSLRRSDARLCRSARCLLSSPRRARSDARSRGLVSQFCFASCYRSLVACQRGALADAVADAELSLEVIDLASARETLRRRDSLRGADRARSVDSRQALIDSTGLGDHIESYGEAMFFDVRAGYG